MSRLEVRFLPRSPIELRPKDAAMRLGRGQEALDAVRRSAAPEETATNQYHLVPALVSPMGDDAVVHLDACGWGGNNFLRNPHLHHY